MIIKRTEDTVSWSQAFTATEAPCNSLVSHCNKPVLQFNATPGLRGDTPEISLYSALPDTMLLPLDPTPLPSRRPSGSGRMRLLQDMRATAGRALQSPQCV
ncbi:5'-AMP-activated protein kinase subunit beta-2 [Platysternon megacephalum]|uniref:5'-AMP-activated protein kinase subunit beta-2 n=1 Tax=Platysternon megacephalum TaxID=55544 RepID=A0A4D9ECE1_9SAUR|nr:5'-AMP-activated protein kinase subunit beta-2 [Platysternon megacephalum]